MIDLVRELVAALRWSLSKGDVCRCLGKSVCHAHAALARAEKALAEAGS